MSKNHYWKFVVAGVITALIAGVGLVPNVAATAPNPNIVVDCTVNIGTEWDVPIPDENMGLSGGTQILSNLHITWDATNLYVGVSTPPYGNFTIYIDNGTTGGATTASWGGTHQISGSGVGYEYSFTNSNTNPVIEIYSGGWTTTGAPSAFSCLTTSGNNDIEWAIPWNNIGVAAGTSQVTVLVTNRDLNNHDLVYSFWPNVSGNTITPSPSFVQGFIFPDPINAIAYSPAPPGPTALSLSQFTANNPQVILMLSGLIILMSMTSLLFFYRHRRKSN